MTKILYLIVIALVVAIAVSLSWYGLSQLPQPENQSPSATPNPSNSPRAPTPTPTTIPSPSTSSNPTSSPSSFPTSTTTPTPAPTPVPTVNPTPTPAPTPTPTPVPTPTPTPTPPPTPITATFNFDNGAPTLTPYMPTPIDQTFNGLTAHFNSTSDTPLHPAFSIQSVTSLSSIGGIINSQLFSGNFLWPSTINRDSLNIYFSQNITSITLNFKTAELNDPGAGSTGSTIRISAYFNSVANSVGSPVTTRGVEHNDLYPEGSLSLSLTGQAFNLIVMDLPSPSGASGFVIDNIIVITG